MPPFQYFGACVCTWNAELGIIIGTFIISDGAHKKPKSGQERWNDISKDSQGHHKELCFSSTEILPNFSQVSWSGKKENQKSNSKELKDLSSADGDVSGSRRDQWWHRPFQMWNIFWMTSPGAVWTVVVFTEGSCCLLCPWDIANSVIGPFKLFCREWCWDSFSSWDQSWCITRGWNKLLSKRVMIVSVPLYCTLAAVTNWVALALFHKLQGATAMMVSHILSQLFLWICVRMCSHVFLPHSQHDQLSFRKIWNLKRKTLGVACVRCKTQVQHTGCGRRICFWRDLFFWSDLWYLYWNNGMH